ncbi:MAG: aspartyl/asparaginyl beta-hydroxylase domain-containing protein [Alcanivoracaceae bacterium]|nr:aspartyl/asparaginyl beta-hydroxylase domain-containing protein [Alcanivoracaceae bacterium]
MLAELFAPKFLVLYTFIITGTYVHFRGKVRHKIVRQLLDHSTIMAPYNCFVYATSAVPNKPYVDMKHLPDLQALQENWQVIRQEALNLFDEGYIKAASQHNDLAFHSFFKTGWKRFYLKWYGDPLPSAETLCPKTVEMVNNIPSLNAVMFALLPAGSNLGLHRDPFAGSLRYHLGLITPNSDDCYIAVDGESYSWRDGEGVVFDETYMHTAFNNTDVDRIILFCDVERPLRWKFAQLINRFFKKIAVASAATQNEEGDKVGVLNKVFSYVYLFRARAKELKKQSKTTYYVLKWLMIGGAMYYIFFRGLGAGG